MKHTTGEERKLDEKVGWRSAQAQSCMQRNITLKNATVPSTRRTLICRGPTMPVILAGPRTKYRKDAKFAKDCVLKTLRPSCLRGEIAHQSVWYQSRRLRARYQARIKNTGNASAMTPKICMPRCVNDQ